VPEHRHLQVADTETIRQAWLRWGLPLVTPERIWHPDEVVGLEGRDLGGPIGLVTLVVDGGLGEIISLEAYVPCRGHGSFLLAGAEAEMARRGARRARVRTTNDNLRAQAFYQRRGWRLVGIELDGMERVRALKPGLLAAGAHGLPLRDVWSFEKGLGSG
jgi:GNAT superfamily N-acetyltransferase